MGKIKKQQFFYVNILNDTSGRGQGPFGDMTCAHLIPVGDNLIGLDNLTVDWTKARLVDKKKTCNCQRGQQKSPLSSKSRVEIREKRRKMPHMLPCYNEKN
jgi:hypothetical protein